jgi:peptidoglycan/LPS O-acetylase OafA/YrhL
VLGGHLRSYIFQNYHELAHPGLLVKVFYFATGLGHRAVIIFFALSGFLVGGKALADILHHRVFGHTTLCAVLHHFES